MSSHWQEIASYVAHSSLGNSPQHLSRSRCVFVLRTIDIESPGLGY